MREDTLRDLVRTFREMSLLIRHRALPIGELFRELSSNEFISRVLELREMHELSGEGSCFRESWNKTADELNELSESERSTIKSIGRSLGASDIEGQLSMLEVNAALLENFAEEAHEQYIQKGKLYRSMGTLAGLFAAVMII